MQGTCQSGTFGLQIVVTCVVRVPYGDFSNRQLFTASLVTKDDKGIYTWKLVLKPGEKREISYKVKITYPKDMNIEGL